VGPDGAQPLIKKVYVPLKFHIEHILHMQLKWQTQKSEETKFTWSPGFPELDRTRPTGVGIESRFWTKLFLVPEPEIVWSKTGSLYLLTGTTGVVAPIVPINLLIYFTYLSVGAPADSEDYPLCCRLVVQRLFVVCSSRPPRPAG